MRASYRPDVDIAQKRGGEGIVGKDGASAYVLGRPWRNSSSSSVASPPSLAKRWDCGALLLGLFDGHRPLVRPEGRDGILGEDVDLFARTGSLQTDESPIVPSAGGGEGHLDPPSTRSRIAFTERAQTTSRASRPSSAFVETRWFLVCEGVRRPALASSVHQPAPDGMVVSHRQRAIW